MDDEISDIDSDDDDDEEEEEEPSSKKPKKMPTDEELKKTVLGLLDNVDLEKVTMKNVLQQVTCFASALLLFISFLFSATLRFMHTYLAFIHDFSYSNYLP